MSNYINQDDIVIKFRNVNQYENNLFIDNLNVNTSVTNFEELINPNKKLLKIIDILGRETNEKPNILYFISMKTVQQKENLLFSRIFFIHQINAKKYNTNSKKVHFL